MLEITAIIKNRSEVWSLWYIDGIIQVVIVTPYGGRT